MSKTVYLGGPITGLGFDEAKDWRDESSEFVERLRHLGWTELSPMRDKERYRVEGPLSAYFDEGEVAVRQDLADIHESDAVIFNVLGATHVSLGSMAEMGFAYALGKPIIVVTEGEQNIHHHVFTDYMATKIANSLESALIELVSLDLGGVPYAPPLPETHRVFAS